MQVLKVPSAFSREPLRRPAGRPPIVRAVLGAAASLLLVAGVFVPAGADPVRAQAADTKPYDEQLLRLAEILGAVHYLRELCSADDGQLWRDRMKELLDTEGATALRRARLTRSFNQGYRSYRRTYATCTPTAQSSIERFLAEGIEIGDGLVKNAR
ncbi:MAG TPA: TIGR02301 family protein [Hyphomicrobium sp.]|nr:TIGR02301 family protein [Hyphomicrobium sp.]